MDGGLDDHSDQDHAEGGSGAPDVAWVPQQGARQCRAYLVMFAQNKEMWCESVRTTFPNTGMPEWSTVCGRVATSRQREGNKQHVLLGHRAPWSRARLEGS